MLGFTLFDTTYKLTMSSLANGEMILLGNFLQLNFYIFT